MLKKHFKKRNTSINLTKYVQCLYEENYKSLIKDIKDLNMWIAVTCSWIGRLVFWRHQFLPTSSTVNAILNIPTSYYMHIDVMILKFIWKGKRYRIVNTILKENKVRRLTPPNFNAFYKLNNLKQYGCFKRRQIDQWVKIKSPETEPSKYSQFTFTK